MKNYKILLIHSLPPKKFRFKGVEEVELLFNKFYEPKYILQHNFFVSPTKAIKNYDFDVIILTSTFLERISNRKTYGRILKKYSFLEKKKSFKIGLPQDDYWGQNVRDEWYSKNLNLIISVFDKNQWPIIYPLSIKKNVKIIRGHTTYINSKKFKVIKNKSYNKRLNDIVYRTVGMPFFPNRFGLLKSLIGEIFFKKHRLDFKMDVSNDPKDLIYGDKWVDFLSNSKAVLGSNSGSSVILRDHNHINRLINFKKNYDKNSLVDFEKDFFNKKDRGHELTDISPRNIEAAMTMTLQILVEGKYGGILKKDEDYFCLKEDFSNSSELIPLLKDSDRLRKITLSCFNRIKNNKTLNEKNLINKINNHIEIFLKKNPKKNNQSDFKNMWYNNFKNFCFAIFHHFKFLIKKVYYEFNNS